jgi:hypothetical protein
MKQKFSITTHTIHNTYTKITLQEQKLYIYEVKLSRTMQREQKNQQTH